MSGRLISRNVDIDFGPLPRDETAFEMQEKISKLPLKPRVPIEQQLPGAYELIGATTDGSKELHLTIDLSEDQQVSEHGQKIGVWSLSGRELELKLDYEAAGPIVVRRKQAETFIGSDKWEDGSTWKWQLQRVLPVAVWNIAIAEKVSQQTLYSNGRVNSPHAIASSAYWFLKGDGIKFNWGHFQFGPNRRTFAGRRAGGAPVKGQLVSVRQ